MRIGFVGMLLLTLLFAGGYFSVLGASLCPAPRTYSLGAIDERFLMPKEDVERILKEAEGVWEDAVGRDLFTYGEEGDLTVNFVFDERQALADTEATFKEKLDATETMSDALKETYTMLVDKYNVALLSYNKNAEAYEARLAAYNEEVEKNNERGGAPQDVYARLQSEKQALDIEQKKLNAESSKLNALVSEINGVGEKANRIITTYNEGVGMYNETFGVSREFTQGDYHENTINIYTFTNEAELLSVLVHELGHALPLDHVDGEESAMHYLLKDGASEEGLTKEEVTLSEEDLAEFERVCGKKTLTERIMAGIERVNGSFQGGEESE